MSNPRPGARQAFAMRLAQPADAPRIAALATQLGYPSYPAQVERRLESVRHDADHAVWVAEAYGEVVAWLHVFVCRLVEADRFAEIGGLVVDEACRAQGAGRLLMGHAEQWAREKGCRGVYLRSNVIRKEAHSFYERLGYTRIKTQHAFRKDL